MEEQVKVVPMHIDETLGSDVVVEATSGDKTEDIKMSDKELKKIMKQAYLDRSAKIKQNKAMLEEMEIEVRYWKAQSDILKYRFEKMDYYIKNTEIEPKYLALIQEQKDKDEAVAGLHPEKSMF